MLKDILLRNGTGIVPFCKMDWKKKFFVVAKNLITTKGEKRKKKKTNDLKRIYNTHSIAKFISTGLFNS
jgi:hypothetical protein